jgi:hypothetical protein
LEWFFQTEKQNKETKTKTKKQTKIISTRERDERRWQENVSSSKTNNEKCNRENNLRFKTDA